MPETYNVSPGGLMRCCLNSLEEQLATNPRAALIECGCCHAGIEFVAEEEGGYWRWADWFISPGRRELLSTTEQLNTPDVHVPPTET